MALREVVLLEYSHMTMHLKEDFIRSYLRFVKGAHARFLFQGTDDLFFCVGTRAHSHRRPIDYIFVD